MDASAARTANIRLWVAAAGGPAKFAERYGAATETGKAWTQPQVSQWIAADNPKGIGHKLAREIERRVGEPHGAMDRAPADDSSRPMRLDPTILAESIAALRQVAKRRGWSYDPELHAESTCYAYELWQLLPSQPTTADVIDIGERIAERLRKELEGGDGGDKSGPGAGAGANDRSQPGKTGVRKARVAGSAK